MTYDENNNYIVINRSVADGIFWKTDEKFCSAAAWIDLLILANWRQTAFTKNTHTIIIERGQLGWSKKALADRWNWSQSKVTRFLARLEKEGMANIETTQLTTVVTILNYDKFQLGEHHSNITRTSPEQQSKTYKEGKESKEGKEVTKGTDKEAIYEEWNHRAKANTLMPIARTFSKGRQSKAASRLKDSNWRLAFSQAVAQLPLIPKPGFDWQPDIDWMIANDENVFKILEGKYDTQASVAGQSKPVKIDTKTQAKVAFVAGELNSDPWAYLSEAFMRSSSGEFQECLIIQAMDQTQLKDLDNPQAYFRAVLESKIKETL